MRNYLKIPKPLYTPSPSPPTSPPSPPQPQPPPPHKPNSPMLYYTIVVVATATLVLGIYHLVIIRLCTTRYHRQLQQRPQLSRPRRNPISSIPNNNMPTLSRSLSSGSDTGCLISSFKYKKGAEGGHNNQLVYDMECSVCLSVFEEGEEVKRLPMCDHCFHASCIDMWLYGHIHCPLCRAPVVEPPPPPPPPPSPGSSSV